ncbi:PspC domain-containing protein [Ornithinimicrobium sp. Y1694]|uniref:PspC domain-containing protein n=1 Tax=Ornithinimicrobium sp. Y1694 TaxID=3418590 RepID=UPI003CE98A3A
MNEIKPPVLPLPDQYRTSGPQGPQDTPPTGSPYGQPTTSTRTPTGSRVDQGFATLQRSPLRRNSYRGIVGGVCAGIAESTGLSVVAVRAIAVVLGFFGVGIGAYLLGWALLPDEGGRTHAEQAMKDGRARSMVVLGLGAFALLGVLSWIFKSWPLLIAAAVVAFVVAKKKGHFSDHAHG